MSGGARHLVCWGRLGSMFTVCLVPSARVAGAALLALCTLDAFRTFGAAWVRCSLWTGLAKSGSAAFMDVITVLFRGGYG